MRAQELGQPFTWIVSGASKVGSRSSSWATVVAARALVSTMASLQYSMPVHAMAPRRNVDGAVSRPSADRPVDQLVDPIGGDIQDDQLLLRRESDAVTADGCDEVGQPGQHLAADPADHGSGPDVEEAVVLGVHADVVPTSRRRRGRRRPVEQGATEVVLLQHLTEPLDAPVRDQELQSRTRTAAGGSPSRGTRR